MKTVMFVSFDAPMPSRRECYGFADGADCAAEEKLKDGIIWEIIGLVQVSVAVLRQESNVCFRGSAEILSADAARLDFSKRFTQCQVRAAPPDLCSLVFDHVFEKRI